MDEYELLKANTIRYKKIKRLLKMVYNYDHFRPKQYEIINRLVTGEDVCAILPTGYGKSLTFQIPALYLDKPAIIISPLISLMDDQKLILDGLDITSCCFNSTANKPVMRQDMLQCKYQFIYITPESIVTMEDFLKSLNEKVGISLVAIDEAHCISSYGFDFRPSYRKLTFIKKCLPNVPILAVTATATNIVATDIIDVLGLKTGTPIKTSFDRPNLYIEARNKTGVIKDVYPIISEHPDESIIIYCLTIKETEKIGEILKNHEVKYGIYHSKLHDREKKKTHKNFINDKINVVVATIAFGMGINKKNVRVVIHYGSPRNLEGYYQEIGRAGRDGEKSYCYVFHSNQDYMLQKTFIANNRETTSQYQKTQLSLLNVMQSYLKTDECRRRVLLKYFDENFVGKCDFCDNCCRVHVRVPIITTNQDVQRETKMLIDLIESIKTRSFGMGMYIKILRGSNDKTINTSMKRNAYYGTGKHKSVNWWKELCEKLIENGFLQQMHIQGKFAVQVIKVTKKGITWTNMIELNGLIEPSEMIQLEPMQMSVIN